MRFDYEQQYDEERRQYEDSYQFLKAKWKAEEEIERLWGIKWRKAWKDWVQRMEERDGR